MILYDSCLRTVHPNGSHKLWVLKAGPILPSTTALGDKNRFDTSIRLGITPSTQSTLFPILMCFFLIPKEIPFRKHI